MHPWGIDDHRHMMHGYQPCSMVPLLPDSMWELKLLLILLIVKWLMYLVTIAAGMPSGKVFLCRTLQSCMAQ